MRRSSGTVSLTTSSPPVTPGERHERADLDVVGGDRVRAAAQGRGAVDGHHVRADPVDRGAHRDEHPRQVLDVRLGGGVADHGRAARQRRGHQRVLGRHHRRLVHQEVARPAGPARRREHDVAVRARPSRRARGTRRGADRAGGGRSRRRRAAACGRGRSGPAAGRRAGTRRGSARPARGRRRCSFTSRRRRHLAGAEPGRPGRRATASSAIIASTSLIRGTLRRITSSSVSRQAARIGSAPFLLPAGTIVPDSGTPPSITNFSIGSREVRCGQRSWWLSGAGRSPASPER